MIFKMFYTYVLRSKKDKKYYIGQTANLKLRIERHNLGREKSTKYRVPFELVYYKVFDTRSEAMEYEKYLKTRKKSRVIEKLINVAKRDCSSTG